MSDDDIDDDDNDSFLREIAHITPLGARLEDPVRCGQELSHFGVEREIGRGGMGVVYAGVDRRLGRRVALKVLPADVVREPARRARFLREARSASAVTHPNIAAVYDIGEAEDCLFIAMELVPGRTLRAVLRERGKLPRKEALRIAAQVARGLGRAHRAGIVHRDIKPENIMLGSDGWVKILDFGLAQPPESDEPVDRVVGTPGYMSPEQEAGDMVTATTDVYALGVTLHEMLTGERPRGDCLVSGALGRVVASCLSRLATQRPRDGDELASLLESTPVQGRHVRGLAAVVVVACLLAGAFAWRFAAAARTPGPPLAARTERPSVDPPGAPQASQAGLALAPPAVSQIAHPASTARPQPKSAPARPSFDPLARQK